MRCNICGKYYPKNEGNLVDNLFHCNDCISKIKIWGEYEGETVTCCVCHNLIPIDMSISYEVYVDRNNTAIKYFCKTSKIGVGLDGISDIVARCYTCGRFFEPDTGKCVEVKWKISKRKWVRVDRWLCSTHAALL